MPHLRLSPIDEPLVKQFAIFGVEWLAVITEAGAMTVCRNAWVRPTTTYELIVRVARVSEDYCVTLEHM